MLTGGKVPRTLWLSFLAVFCVLDFTEVQKPVVFSKAIPAHCWHFEMVDGWFFFFTLFLAVKLKRLQRIFTDH